ncbi:hypothetical protein [Caballeronia glathei]|uniref:hypothetical protein n=1 Tax=Caballeronia glathei TaxID=60547 RepID=UPI001267B768|nr:hypothetical protein [Caballeronia glathei]
MFTDDVAHNHIQVYRPEGNSVFCADAGVAWTSRRFVFDHAAESGATICTTHFSKTSAARIVRQGDVILGRSNENPRPSSLARQRPTVVEGRGRLKSDSIGRFPSAWHVVVLPTLVAIVWLLRPSLTGQREKLMARGQHATWSRRQRCWTSERMFKVRNLDIFVVVCESIAQRGVIV